MDRNFLKEKTKVCVGLDLDYIGVWKFQNSSQRDGAPLWVGGSLSPAIYLNDGENGGDTIPSSWFYHKFPGWTTTLDWKCTFTTTYPIYKTKVVPLIGCTLDSPSPKIKYNQLTKPKNQYDQ